MPTPLELITEITKGPFADELASAWVDVFGDKLREGQLRPDAAYAIHAILTDPSRRTRVVLYVSRGVFLASIAPLAIGLAMKGDATLTVKWQTILNLATGGDEQIYLANPQVQGLLDVAVSDGLMSQEQRDSLKDGGTITCSRSDELGWETWSYSLVIEAKARAA